MGTNIMKCTFVSLMFLTLLVCSSDGKGGGGRGGGGRGGGIGGGRRGGGWGFRGGSTSSVKSWPKSSTRIWNHRSPVRIIPVPIFWGGGFGHYGGYGYHNRYRQEDGYYPCPPDLVKQNEEKINSSIVSGISEDTMGNETKISSYKYMCYNETDDDDNAGWVIFMLIIGFVVTFISCSLCIRAATKPMDLPTSPGASGSYQVREPSNFDQIPRIPSTAVLVTPSAPPMGPNGQPGGPPPPYTDVENPPSYESVNSKLIDQNPKNLNK